jgi:hypothetical protein
LRRAKTSSKLIKSLEIVTELKEMDRLAVELMEDVNLPGRVFFQIISGNEYGHLSIQTLGSAGICKGRYLLERSGFASKKQYVPFECTLDAAENIAVQDVTGTDYAKYVVPKYIRPKRVFNIAASKFHPLLPVEQMRIDMILGTYRIKGDLCNPVSKKKYVWLYRTSLKWKLYENIELPKEYKNYTLKEILFDKMTLFTACVSLPKLQTFKLSANNLENRFTSDNLDVKVQNPYLQQRLSLIEKFQVILMKRSMSMDIFIFFVSQIIWFIICGLNSEKINTKLTVIFMLLSAILVVNLRFILSSILNRISSYYQLRAKSVNVTESNGRSFFINGWSDWSYCGSIRQDEERSIYSSAVMQSYNNGGVGTALPINLGQGEIPVSPSYFNKNGKSFINGKKYMMKKNFSVLEEKRYKDYLASDMFTLLSDTKTKLGVVIGFLSQKNHFGCVATNENYDQISAHISGDGVLCPSGSQFTSDYLAVYVTAPDLENHHPFNVYMSMTGDEHKVKNKLSKPFFIDPVSPTAASEKSGMNANNNEMDSEQIPLRKSVFSIPEGTLPKRKKNISNDVVTGNTPIGWSSWSPSTLFRGDTEDDVKKKMQIMKEKFPVLPPMLSSSTLHAIYPQSLLLQMDDSYQSHWGDWMSINPKFSSNTKSLKPLADLLKANSFIPGLRMSPFEADKNSHLLRRIPGIILKTFQKNFFGVEKEIPCNARNPSLYGLDITNIECQNYLKECIKTITKTWGFRYLKVDYLCSCILQDCQQSLANRTLTRAQIMQLAMKIINEAMTANDSEEHEKKKDNEVVAEEDDEEDDVIKLSADSEDKNETKTKSTVYTMNDRNKKKKETATETNQPQDEQNKEDDQNEDREVESSSESEEEENTVNRKSSYFLVSGGAPLGSVIGRVHANRISPGNNLNVFISISNLF